MSDHSGPPSEPADHGLFARYGQTGWDRRSHLDRRRRQRRRLDLPVETDRRTNPDRRRNRRGGRRKMPVSGVVRLPRESSSRLDSVAAVLNPGILEPRASKIPRARAPSVLVTVCHGLAASSLAAWDLVLAPEADGGVYRVMDGEMHRRIGSALLALSDLEAVDSAEARYEAEYRRAYEAVYHAYPALRGASEEHAGQVIVRAPLNDLLVP